MEKYKNINDLFSLLITPMICPLRNAQQEIYLHCGSLAHRIYGKKRVVERYNCSYSLNESFRAMFEHSDLQVAGTSKDGDVRIIELPQCHFFLATLFQPQLSLSESFPHPLVVSFLRSAEG